MKLKNDSKTRKNVRLPGKNREHLKNILLLVPLFEAVFLKSPVFCYAAMAASVSSVTKPLTTLKTLVTSIIGIIGIIILAKEIMEFATAYRQSDNTTMASAIKGMVGGFLMAGIGGVLALLGFK